MTRRALLSFFVIAIAIALAAPASAQYRVKWNGKVYVTGRNLGGGRWANAFEAHEEGGKRKVAIKIASNSDTSDGGGDTFNRELRIMQTLKGKHPSLPRNIYGIGAIEGSNGRALVMELYDAGQVGSLNKKEAVDMAVQLLDGVGHLHAAGFWHGDITPTNVLRDKEGQVYLIDFGRAKKIEEPRDWNGWPEYSAPEVLKPRNGHLKDIYSIGALLKNKLGGGGSPALQAIVARATHQDPSKRFQSAGEFRDALKKLGKE